MSKIDDANRKAERYLFDGLMKENDTDQGPCLGRWPIVNQPVEVDDSDWVSIGTIHVDLENETETFVRNPELSKPKPD